MSQIRQDGYKFERHICEILYKTNPYHLSYYDGGPDRGRDICVQYQHNGKIYNVIVECKCYSSGVSKEVIMPALNWATVHQPDLLYLWISPYLTPAAKDFVQAFEKKYHIAVQIEEAINIEHYSEYLHDDNATIWTTLYQKIIDSCTLQSTTKAYVPEHKLDKLENAPFLVDREHERQKLINHPQKAFYLQGVSACGKTQLLKYVAYIFIQKGQHVFWHTIRSGSVNQQCTDFFHTLARYFESIYHDKTLLEYFNTYGFHLSQDMESVVLSLLSQHNPIIFLDDVHNCQKENVTLKTLFKELVKRQICRIYFSGWFNIFDFLPHERSLITLIVLEGMKKPDLDLIIQHCFGARNPAVAGLIEQRYYGLPGYAVLADKDMTVDDIHHEDDFLVYFMSLLSFEEQILLFSLSLLSTDIPGDFIKKQGYAIQLTSLENKHLLVTRKSCYAVHDKYRPFLSHYVLDEALQNQVIVLITRFAEIEPVVILDIVNYRLLNKQYKMAWKTLCDNFQVLLACQYYSPMLNLLQTIEHNSRGQIDIAEIVAKKIVLLERLGNYSICLRYISLLNSAHLFDSPTEEMTFYIQLRCLFFSNRYDDILTIYKENYYAIADFEDKDIYIQILFIIGRVFYIRGSSKGALIYYLLAYYNAHQHQIKSLEVKAIHRIAMVERRLGLFAASRKSFETLSELGTFITPKRRSYIYYRIAKCFYNEGDLESAKEYNEKSIRIKESYGDTRGLVFSETLNAQISLKEGNLIEAYCCSSNACEHADKLGLNKEWLASILIQFRVIASSMIELANSPNVTANLIRSLRIASEEKLLIRLKALEKVTKQNWPIIHSRAQESRKSVEAELSQLEQQLEKYYFTSQSLSMEKEYNLLIQHNISISQSLLMRSGFLDPFDTIDQ